MQTSDEVACLIREALHSSLPAAFLSSTTVTASAPDEERLRPAVWHSVEAVALHGVWPRGEEGEVLWVGRQTGTRGWGEGGVGGGSADRETHDTFAELAGCRNSKPMNTRSKT